ncbi:MAG: Ig-like domain-containing protein, partial [Micrococcales bacterium]|nr:Ig-like domain-containing protein [Micrococcales bacterium]
MTGKGEQPRRRLRTGPAAAFAVTVALVVGAFVAQGYDAQDTERVESSVWVARDAGQYARVNTSLGQIDTVRTVDEPKLVVQNGSAAAVVAQSGRVLWPVNPASPGDMSEGQDQGGSVGTPEGTDAVVAGGDYVLYRTNAGALWRADLTRPQARPVRLEPAPGTQATSTYSATVAAVDADGRVAVYSAGEGAVRVLDVTGSLTSGPVKLTRAPEKGADVSMAIVSGRWVLLDAGAGRLWTSSHTSPVDLDVRDVAKLQVSGGSGSKVYVADGAGLLEVGVSTGDTRRLFRATGTPARPVVMGDGAVVAAWLSPGGGTLWTSDAGERPLAVDRNDVSAQRQLNPVIVSNGDRAVVEETGTGLLWTLDGTAIPLSQWSRIDQQTTSAGDRQVTDITEQLPPVAVPDSFGVRSGTFVRLPVLLNDYDPNAGDVLTIDPGSVSELSNPGFGQLTLGDANQMFVIEVHATSGSASFSYRVSDGTLLSENAATVTLTVVPEPTNSAPVWCVEGCTQTWPVATLAPGGTARVRILDAWVDPEGDPFVLTSATVADEGSPVRAVASADGSVTVHHTDINGGPTSGTVMVTVTDSHGVQTERELAVVVTAAPTLEVEPVVLVTGQDVPATAAVANHVSSGSGSYRLVSADASAASADGLDVVASPDNTV